MGSYGTLLDENREVLNIRLKQDGIALAHGKIFKCKLLYGGDTSRETLEDRKTTQQQQAM